MDEAQQAKCDEANEMERKHPTNPLVLATAIEIRHRILMVIKDLTSPQEGVT